MEQLLDDVEVATCKPEEVPFTEISRVDKREMVDEPVKATEAVDSVGSDKTTVIKDSRSMLDDYITKDSVTGKFVCQTCGKSNKQKNCIKMHIEAIHFPGRFVYFCSICVKPFNGKNSLTVHMTRSHRDT